MRVIFVCSGNICRSPMAEGMFRDLAERSGVRAAVISMGTLGLIGRSASTEAIEACREIGVDISGHRSQGVSLGILRHATDVLVMEEAHRRHIVRGAPDLRPRVHLLGTFDPLGAAEIDDPVGGPIEDFRACRTRLDRALRKFLESRTGTAPT